MSSGLVAFLVVLALCVATVLLGRSLFKHLRKVPASFDAAQPSGTARRPGSPAHQPRSPAHRPDSGADRG